MAETKGTAKRTVGWLTGDRQVEAEGRIEERTGRPPEAEAEVEAVKEEVKQDHFDYGPAGEPQPPQ